MMATHGILELDTASPKKTQLNSQDVLSLCASSFHKAIQNYIKVKLKPFVSWKEQLSKFSFFTHSGRQKLLKPTCLN